MIELPIGDEIMPLFLTQDLGVINVDEISRRW